MAGLRKVLITVVTLLLESGAFVLVTLITKSVSEGILIAYFAAVVAALGVYTTGNVVSKKTEVTAPEEKKVG